MSWAPASTSTSSLPTCALPAMSVPCSGRNRYRSPFLRRSISHPNDLPSSVGEGWWPQSRLSRAEHDAQVARTGVAQHPCRRVRRLQCPDSAVPRNLGTSLPCCRRCSTNVNVRVKTRCYILARRGPSPQCQGSAVPRNLSSAIPYCRTLHESSMKESSPIFFKTPRTAQLVLEGKEYKRNDSHTVLDVPRQGRVRFDKFDPDKG